ncbi:bacterial Ig-like domain-containing protein [Lactococcus garvieae]|uniref:bacterial Ig-like domain-containing protein n=1 Tax=Lactococcus garvieae TaxID=1363 RepID=UPI00254B0F1D|nr:bacterial Ig-like domain-containing protein [Lactococcus garvieae]
MMNNKTTKRLYSALAIIFLLGNTIFAPVVSASWVGGGSNKRTVYGVNYDVQMQTYNASTASKFPVHAGGEERYRVINTYPGTNRNTVKNSIYTITVPNSIDFSSIKDFSLLGENSRGFTSGSNNWLNEEKASYIMDPSLYTVISDENSRTITVTIPNTSDWTSINSTSFQFSYTGPLSEENDITWRTSVYSAGGTYELVDNMELYNELLVHHVDQDNNTVAEDTVVTDRFGMSHSANSYKKVIDGYTYDHIEGDTVATIGSNISELILVYSKNVVAGADVTIKYVDEENQPIPGVSNKIISGNIGDDYDASTSAYKLIIDGYTLDESKLPENATGKLGDKAQTVTYVYNKNKEVGSVTLRYVDTFGQPIEDLMFGNIIGSLTFEGEVGNSADDDLGYVYPSGWIMVSEFLTDIVYSESPQTFDIVYDRIGTIYVNYEDTNGVKLKPEWRNTDYLSQFDWTTGEYLPPVAYEVSPLDIPGYEMIRVEGDSAKGDIGVSEIKHVTFVYSNLVVVNVHDSTLDVGDNWSPEDNFDSALDKDGQAVDFKDVKVSGNVDTSKAGSYEITYSYDGVESKAIITVKAKQTAVNVHDSTLYVGDTWSAEDNFDSALDKDGQAVDFKDVKVSGNVDTSKAGSYEITYSYDGVESKAVITVKAKQTAVNVHDSTLYVGDTWSAEDNFDSALDKDGQAVDFKDVKVSGNVDTSKAGSYEITYSYDGLTSTAIVTVLKNEEGQDLAHIVVHDSELQVGEDWLPEDNFDEATLSDGKEENFSDIIVNGTVDTKKPGTYEVTYSIPEEHLGRNIVEGHYTATAKIVVSEEKDNDDRDSNSKGENSDSEKDNSSSTNNTSGKNDFQNIKGLPKTGEHTSALIFMLGIAFLVLGSIFSVLRIKKNKK